MKKMAVLFYLFCTLNIHADFNSALDLYESGNYSHAYNEFLEMAELGEKRSQFNLGVMFYNGQHVEKNINKAYAWMKLSVQGKSSSPKEKAIFQKIASGIDDKAPAESEYQELKALYSTEVLIDKLYPVLVEPVGDEAFEATAETIVEPRWPREALANGIQGWVRLQFDIDKTGVPRNIHLLESFPKKIFNSMSLNAVKKWRFKQKKNTSGESILSQNMRYTLSFRFEGQDPIKIKENVYKKTEQLANDGDPIAQFNIGFWDKTLRNSKSDINPNEWFLKASVQGHPAAQYELGRSLVFGKGCIADKSKGLEWLMRSATNGNVRANLLLGSLATKMKDIDSQRRAVEFLQNEEKLPPDVRLNFAWMLATSPYKDIANPQKAIELSNSFSSKTFRDEATLYEIKAAAYAAMGNYKKAIALQEDALEEAEDQEADLEEIKQHLAAYQKKELWF